MRSFIGWLLGACTVTLIAISFMALCYVIYVAFSINAVKCIPL